VDVERALVAKIASTGQLEDAISKGVRSDLFDDEDAREVFNWMVSHRREWRTPPSLTVCREEYPEFDWSVIQDPLAYVVDKFLTLAKVRLAQEQLLELAALTKDPKKQQDIDVHFLEVSRKLATLVPSTEVSFFKRDLEKRIDSTEQMQKEGKKPGVPFGFPSLDRWTGGIQPHELVTIHGFSGLGKSTLSMVIAYNAWAAGYTPLIISLEMEARQMLRKFDAMSASLDYYKLKQLEMAPEDFKQWREIVSWVKGKTSEIPIIDSIRHCTPDHVFAETIRHAPQVVIIDYISLMRSSRPGAKGASMWQTITEITQDLKQNARTLGVPIIAMAQTNRSGAKDGSELDNVGYSLSIVQDSDIVLGLFADDAMKERKEMEIRLNKNRDGRIDKFTAIWDHEKTLYREKVMKDLYQRRKEQQEEEREMEMA
jgi:replicative DNA helicase